MGRISTTGAAERLTIEKPVATPSLRPPTSNAITDEVIYEQLKASDDGMGRWTAEDPSLRSVLRWLRARR
ncbi:hypothetical protein Neosp_004999 [[Neocosmospora] mangrovei]